MLRMNCMTEQIQIGVKVEKSLKDEVDVILRGLDIKPTTAINGLYQYISQHGELPFVISTSVKTPKDIAGGLFKNLFSLQNTLRVFFDKVQLKQSISRGEVLIILDILHDFVVGFRQNAQYLGISPFGQRVVWKDAVGAVEGIHEILENNVKYSEEGVMYLDDFYLSSLSGLLSSLCTSLK
ncbi:addiction module antitoxin, RelB/DinJ family [Serratia marcescens]|nr:addiction module antitoxin, RelB/DinJ family [Serratia marcescens]CAI2433364.1 addiction module antitoxin, RelB/DinJ family [Serratia marcescens]